MSRYHEDPPEGWCADCGKPCVAKEVDFGIGAYEYWGARGTHHAYAWVSPCCEAEVKDDPPEDPEDEEDEPC